MALGPYICIVCTMDFLTQDDARARICDIHHVRSSNHHVIESMLPIASATENCKKLEFNLNELPVEEVEWDI